MEEKLQCSQLPMGWVWGNFGNVVIGITDFQANGSFATLKENVQYVESNGYAILVRLKDLRTNLSKVEQFVYTDKQGYDFLKKSSLRGGEVLVSNVGSVGTTMVMPAINQPATLAPNMFLVTLGEIEKKYFLNYCKSTNYWREIERVSGGSGMSKINKGEYRSIVIPIPPLLEQQRIVTKLEELFTRLDAGIQSLKDARKQLKSYRQSVLKAAVEGELTKAWREKHKGELEPASVLLQRILKERREKWEADLLAKMKASGKLPKDDGWKAKYQEPAAPDFRKLPILPPDWKWVTSNEICASVRDGTHDTPKYVESGVPLITSKNLSEKGLDFSTAKNISWEDH